MLSFDYLQRSRFISGPGVINQLGTLSRELSAKRILIVSDPGVVAAGLYKKGLDSLEAVGLTCLGFHDLHENPSTDDIEAGVKVAKDFRPDLLVGLGGGSSMDCAKGINFVYSCGGRMQDYWGKGKATSDMLPMIAVPTTAGTGSESQSYALISDSQTHVKMACGDPRAACRVALLDPELTVTQPTRVTALTGIDAMTHALETFVTKDRNAVSLAYSRAAWQYLSHSFSKVLEDPYDLDARSRMQIGACMAGMAIEASMLGAAHALANPLTAHFGIAHGQAVGVMMPAVLRANGRETHIAELYRSLLADLGIHVSYDKAGDTLADWFVKHLQMASLADRISLLDLNGASFDSIKSTLGKAAAAQWTASFNPIIYDATEMERLYESVS
jgi:alcohol dehydrogenase